MCGVRSSKALSTSFDWRLLNVFVFVAYNKRNSKISSPSEELESCSQGASIIHVQWSLNIVRMRIRVISWADSFASAHLEEMFTRAQNYSTCWIFGADGTRDEMHWKRHRTLAFSPYGIVHEWSFAKQIALVCAGLYGISHEWSFAKQIYSSSVPTVLVASNQASSLGPILAPFFYSLFAALRGLGPMRGKLGPTQPVVFEYVTPVCNDTCIPGNSFPNSRLVFVDVNEM